MAKDGINRGCARPGAGGGGGLQRNLHMAESEGLRQAGDSADDGAVCHEPVLHETDQLLLDTDIPERCIETVFTDRVIPPTEQRKEKSKGQDISL